MEIRKRLDGESGFYCVAGMELAASLLFREQASPFGVEETVARIQQNILHAGDGWTLIGLRDPAKAVQNAGSNVLPVLAIEACNTKYSDPILKNDNTRLLALLIPCKIAEYKKDDGKTYVGLMNVAVLGRLFGSEIAAVMAQVAADQEKFVIFDPNKPAPAIIRGAAGGTGAGGTGNGAGGGC